MKGKIINLWIGLVSICYLSLYCTKAVPYETTIQSAMKHYYNGNYSGVISILSPVLEQVDTDISNNDVDAAVYLADAYFKTGELAKSKRLLEAVFAAQFDDIIDLNHYQQVILISTMGMIYRQTGLLSAAERALNKAIAIATNSSGTDLSYLLGGLYNELGLVYQRQPKPTSIEFIQATSIDELPRTGKNRIIVAKIANSLHFLIDDIEGHRVVDADEKQLFGHSGAISSLRNLFLPKVQTNKLSIDEKPALIDKVLFATGRTAGQMFERALTLTHADNAVLRATIAINSAKLVLDDVQLSQIDPRLQRARLYLSKLDRSIVAARLQLSLGDLHQQALNKGYSSDTSYRLRAFELYQYALATAKAIDDAELLSYAHGAIGLLYEREVRYKEAEYYAQQAIFHAQFANIHNSLYRWQWLMARIRARQNDIEGSSAMYHQAMFTFRQVLPKLNKIKDNLYTDVVAPLSFEFADVELKRSTLQKNITEKEQTLSNVRNIIEIAKNAEIIDYLGGECELPNVNIDTPDQIKFGTAVLYPIILADRLEILLTSTNGVEQITVPVNANEITRTIRQFRRQVQIEWGSDDYLILGKKLFDWLIKPLISTLEDYSIDTLVIVSDGPLRTIPLAALHDGNHYLVNYFAIATTPSVSLLGSQPLADISLKVYAGGLSESVQGFPALPKVTRELTQVAQRTDAPIHENEQFTKTNLMENISSGGYTVAHIATHGHFSHDSRQSYLLTYNSKLTLAMLGKTMRNRVESGANPLELLVLSACDTAVGDDRAALGLGGIAIQAGAYSVVASLWSIDDSASAELMDEFYAQLVNKSSSKAKSLQSAQLKLIHDRRYRHPSHWAPFLLLGSWL